MTGVVYAESSNVVCLSVSPELVPDVNTYFVTIADVTDPKAGQQPVHDTTVCRHRPHGTGRARRLAAGPGGAASTG